jgi:acetyl esterase/lipase
VQDVLTFLKNKELNTDIVAERKNMETLMGRDIPIVIKPADVDGIAGEWVLAEGANPSKRLLYLHGGGFRMGSPKSHRHITYELSKRAGVAVLAVDYRMQPEFKITARHEDARKAYKWILENGPHNASTADSFYIAGDSAGGRI